MVFQNLDTYLQIRIFQAENITWDDLKTSFGVLNAEKMVMIEIETEIQSDDNFPLWPEKPVSFSGYNHLHANSTFFIYSVDPNQKSPFPKPNYW